MTNIAQRKFSGALLNILFASFGYVAIRVVIAPVRIKLLTSLLDKEDYGLLTLVMLTVSFITLISSLGSLEFMLRKIPGRAADFQFSTLRTIMTYFGLFAGLIALGGAALLMIWQPGHMNLSHADILACALVLVLTVHLTQLVYFLMGRSQYAQSRMLMLLYADAWFLPLLGLMWFLHINISFMLWLWAGWLALSLVVSQKFVSWREIIRHPLPGGRLREILVFGAPLLPVILGEWIFQIQDRYVLLANTDLQALANYTLCFNIAWVGVSTGTSLVDVLVTEFFKARNRVASTDLAILLADIPLRRTFTMMLRYGLVLALPVVLALWIGRTPVILLLSDPKFADAAGIMPWVAPLPFLYIMVVICGRVLLAIDRGPVVGISTLAAAGLHLTFNLLLTPVLAERGAALAGCLAYGLLAIFLGYKARVWRWILWSELRPWRMIAFALITGGALHLPVHAMPGQNFLPLAIGATIAALAMFTLGLVKKSDVQHIAESMNAAPSEPEDAALQEPFARD